MSYERIEKATFAGGCFWCLQGPFDALDGVISTVVGYTGGKIDNPTYEEVCDGTTGHAEAIEITYNPDLITYKELLDIFWRNIDPTTLNQQFADRGTQYRTAIFYHNENQRELAAESKSQLEASKKYAKPLVTEITRATTFYPAENYHQFYYKKNPFRYELYKEGSGRADYIKKHGEK
jgi:methionine-S-sulfoxide reductase